MTNDGGSIGKKKRIVLIVIFSVLLIAIVGTVTYFSIRKGESHHLKAGAGSANSPTKSVETACAPTLYKQTCVDSLASANTTDPKELIMFEFAYAAKTIKDVISKSALIQEANKDPRTQAALVVCNDVLNRAIEDFNRSSIKMGQFDISKVESYAADLNTWLSATVTYQETCIDAFENTTGNVGERMKELLKTSRELASNSVAMVSAFADAVSHLTFTPNSHRRLLKQSDDGIPSFVGDFAKRFLFEGGETVEMNATVSLNGTGHFRTINEAISTIPLRNDKPFIIFVRAGVYQEYVLIPKHVNNVILIGEGPTKTKITGNRNWADGTSTYKTATVVVEGENFMARDIGFENTAGPEKHQAVAIRISGDHAVFYNCQMDGFQDTLYAHSYRQFYSNCTITGTIDFTFGNAAAIFQHCKFIVRNPAAGQKCMVTAQGRTDPTTDGVIVLQKCEILAEPAFLEQAKLNGTTAYLGRPWKEFSRTIIMNTFIDGFIAPEGWSPWKDTFALDTLYYGEYQNTGAGANTTQRVTWKGIQFITPQIAERFTPLNLYVDDSFITFQRIPYQPGMIL